MISFDRVSKRYAQGHDALREISIDIARDELVFLTGHSGAGKSTLLRLIMLMERPSRGQLTVDGRNLATVGARGVPRHRRGIGVVFQNHQLLFDRPVFDNVALPLIIAGYDYREVGRRVRAALDKVGLLERERAMPVTLSGGEQQRVGIARAVVGKPNILLADEPTGNLDEENGMNIIDILVSLAHNDGYCVVIATHDLSVLPKMDLVYKMNSGVLTEY